MRFGIGKAREVARFGACNEKQSLLNAFTLA